MSRYRIVESVRSGIERVHSYEDLEIHHPSRNAKGLITGNPRDFEKGRTHEKVDGEFEEVRKLPDGRELVKKDFVLLRSDAGPVHIPSPVDGFVHYVKGDATAALRIYDRPSTQPGARLMAQVLHMDPHSFALKEGAHVSYGQALGVMSDTGTPGAVHAHVEAELHQFQKYIRDIDTGSITPGGYPGKGKAQADHPESGGDSRQVGEILKHGDKGPRVRELQATLAGLGYAGSEGHALRADGDFAGRTEFAVKAFQRAHGLHVDGVVGDHTRKALEKVGRAPLISERTHPDNALFLQSKGSLAHLPQGTFRSAVELDQAAGALASSAKRAGLDRIDHVMLNTRGDGFIALQGHPHDPGRHLASVDRETAVSQPLQQSTVPLMQEGSTRQHEQTRVHLEQVEHRAGLAIGMRP